MAHGGEIVGKLSSILDLALGIRKVASKPGAKQSAYECTALAGHIGEVVSWAEERSEWIEYPESLTRLDDLQRSVHYVLSIQFEHWRRKVGFAWNYEVWSTLSPKNPWWSEFYGERRSLSEWRK
jgi:hypothetical protein